MTITFPVMMTISCVANVFGIGANAKMATELGKGNRKRAKIFSSFAVYTSAAVVILLSLILLAAEKLHQKPSDCLVVEDAEAGVKSALNGGFLVAGIGPAKDCPNINYPLLSLSELLAI